MLAQASTLPCGGSRKPYYLTRYKYAPIPFYRARSQAKIYWNPVHPNGYEAFEHNVPARAVRDRLRNSFYPAKFGRRNLFRSLSRRDLVEQQSMHPLYCRLSMRGDVAVLRALTSNIPMVPRPTLGPVLPTIHPYDRSSNASA